MFWPLVWIVSIPAGIFMGMVYVVKRLTGEIQAKPQSRLIEDKTCTNTKTVTSARPKVKPAPQPGFKLKPLE